MTYILGINGFHADSSAALLRDGELIAAAEEERFRRIKHWAGFPSEAIRYCLDEAGVPLGDIDHVAINSDPKANSREKLIFAFGSLSAFNVAVRRYFSRAKRRHVIELLEEAFPGRSFCGKLHNVEHHLAHLASCYLVSPFESAVVVSVDGLGDFASAAWA